MRREFSNAVKRARWRHCVGLCEGCGARLAPGKRHFDHDKPDTFGGEPTFENCRVLCTACHGVKTFGAERRAIAKSNRVRDRHVGIKKRRRTIPGRKFDGTPIPAKWVP